ncbi:DUF6235 family protein [Actinokineospora sp. HUAS TT18]|uniref:DUF6235 family protein n=1 Tax=Actinokineospora sp. HUAS TT18 TaxID=3447451 RepID=UPI003F5223BB
MSRERMRLKLNLGLSRLEKWAANAGQAEKNALYRALFAVADGTVFRSYKVLDDVSRSGEFFVVVRENLIVKICFREPDVFGVLYIGAPEEPAEQEVEIS